MSVAVKKNQLELPIPDRRKFQPQNFVHTSLFSEVYVFNDIPIQFKALWERIEDQGRFDQFFNGLVTLMESFSLEEAHNWNHTETLNNLILPMLEILGYGDAKSKNNAILENCGLSIPNEDGSQINLKPSLLFCEDEVGKNYVKNSTKANSKGELRKYLKLPIQTSYYGSTFDRKSNKYEFKKDEIGKRGDVLTNLGPNDQMAEYLKIFNVDWGIFTDGAVWRLYRKEMSASYSEKYYEFDFNDLYNLYRTSGEDQHDEHSEFFEIAKYMFWFFSYDGLIKGPSVVPFTEKVYQESQKYVANIEEDLKERFVHAMTISCNGYLESVREKGHDVDLKLIAKTSESLIFNLIFIRSCESKRVLPVHQDYIHVSLKALVDKIRHFSYNNEYDASAKIVKQGLKDIFNKEVKDNGYDIYEYIESLHSMVESGNNGFGITGFVESVFYPDERSFYKKYKIDNKDMIRLVYQLFYSFNTGKNVQIPFNLITPRQIGSIFESFLEFQPSYSVTNMCYVKKKTKGSIFWQWIDEKLISGNKQGVLPIVKKGGIVFSPDNKERKTSGSFYTPEYIVNHIVMETLGPSCVGKTAEDILKLKVCDPAMGSGHFLLGALEFLAKKITEKKSDESFSEIKRKVLDSSIFGVDINPSAAKLCKLSLWLATALPGLKLERLEDQIKTGNSLISSKKLTNSFNWEHEYSEIINAGGFDAIIGNPPYSRLQAQNVSNSDVLKDIKENFYSAQSGSFDLYIPFIERSIQLVKKKGDVCFILPNTIFTVNYGKNLRSLLAKDKLVHSILNFKQYKVFKGVSTYTCLLHLKKQANHEISYREIIDIKSLPSSGVNESDIRREDLFHLTTISHPDSDANWELKSSQSSGLAAKVKNLSSVTISETVEKIFQGFVTGADKVFVLDKKSEKGKFFVCYSVSMDMDVLIEKEICREVYLGKDVHRYNDSNRSLVVIFPYKRKNDKYQLISMSEMEQKFSNAFEYFKKNKIALEKRESGKYKGSEFYQFSRPQSLDYFDLPKLVMRSFSCQGEVFLDKSGGCCFTPNVYGIIPKNVSQDNYFYMMAYLNSNVVWYLIKNSSSGISNGYYQYTTRYVSPLPIIPWTDLLKQRPELAKEIVSLSKSRLKHLDNSSVAKEIESKIDSLFYQIFNLSRSEVAEMEVSRYSTKS